MYFKTISHACLYIEHLNTRLLIDPWVIGSCYWRSWWNFPKVEHNLLLDIKPTHIYLTHLHWDHFHGPSLRLFEKYNPKILFPKHFNHRLIKDCKKDFKFTNIMELNHGKKYKIGNDFIITSYQFNPIIIDSSIVIEADNTTLLNSNDSKVFGLSLNHIKSNHRDIDFVFRSHSSASPIPQCIKGQDPTKTDRSPKDYARDFTAFAKATGAKFAIPFASSHIYLHELTRKFNKFYSNPQYVKDYFEANIRNGQRCILMPSGSSWSKESSFNLIEYDYSNIQKDTEFYLNENHEKLIKQKEISKKILLNKKAFKNYYDNFLKASSFPLNLINFRFAFLINEIKTKSFFLCIVDGKKSKTNILKINSDNEIYEHNLTFVIKTPIYVFNDCNTKNMHNTFTPSKLLEIILISKNAIKKVNFYFSLVDFYENDCLPINKLLSIRNLIITIRRYREFIDILIYTYKIIIRKFKIYKLYNSLD